jgi:hypothetical protein
MVEESARFILKWRHQRLYSDRPSFISSSLIDTGAVQHERGAAYPEDFAPGTFSSKSLSIAIPQPAYKFGALHDCFLTARSIRTQEERVPA